MTRRVRRRTTRRNGKRKSCLHEELLQSLARVSVYSVPPPPPPRNVTIRPAAAEFLVKVALVHPKGVAKGGAEAGVTEAMVAQQLPRGRIDRLDCEQSHAHARQVKGP